MSMSKQLRVRFDESEYRELQRLAKRKGMTISDWVRDAVRVAAKQQPVSSMRRKLAAIRAAAALNLAPSPDIDEMNGEIEKGYLS